MNFSKGEFGYDLDFLKKYLRPVVLSSEDKQQQLIISPEYQGRIMTSTANGLNGKSFGWLNYDLIASGKFQKNLNAFGGEDRFWLGPEGGQFGLFFKNGKPFDFENCQTPKIIDSEPFELVNQNSTSAEFFKDATLINYSNTEFTISIRRKISLLERNKISELLNANFDEDLSIMGFESENTITNPGDDWKKNSGLLSIWVIGMFNANDQTTVIIPINDADLPINSNYFGELNKERLQIKNNIVLFKGDGNYRSKIGITPQNTKPIFGSFDLENNLLSIVQFNFENEDCYVNSKWELQKEPYKGDVINSYNDGPLNNIQLGKFYELETSSAARELKNNESITHIHRTFHFEGNPSALNSISKELLNADSSDLSNP